MRLGCVAGLVAGLSVLAGCGPQLGALLYYATPEQKNKADYALPPGRIAILIDDPYGSLPRSDLRNQVHSTLVAELTANKVPVAVVPMAEVARLEQSNRDFDNLSIRAVGEQVHADQVLYISIQTFTTGEDAKHGVFQGKARAQVKVCSTERKAAVRVWPTTGDGYVVEIQQPADQAEDWGDGKMTDRYAQALAERLARRTAMLFYKHSAEAETDLTTGRTGKPSR